MAAKKQRRAARSGRKSPRAIWSGSIGFGLVNVPVRMYSAVDEQDLRFHLLHRKDDGRIGYEKVCKKEDKPVPDAEIVKAYEISEARHVYVEDEDFEAAAGAKYRSIDICDFVPYDQIDPIYFERTYYLGPGDGAETVYALLIEAMEDSGLAGIAKYVMREKQHLGCLRVRDGVILLEKMYFADEIRPADEIEIARVRVGRREREMAAELIESFSGSFDIAKYRDDYREALLEVIEAKRKGKEVHVDRELPSETPDLMEALRASIEAHGNGKRGARRNGSNGGLASLTKDELRRRAKRQGLQGYSTLRKDELVEALSSG
jgi:DNA end-binding protein Ku